MGAPTFGAAERAVRRRRHDQVPREKTSLSLRTDILAAAKELVSSGSADNLSAFVEIAVEEKIRRSKRDALYASYAAAAQDGDFQTRMSDVQQDFGSSVADGLHGR